MSQDRKKYDFASVGELKTVFENRLVETTADLPVGIKTPMELGYGTTGPFKMHNDLRKQIADNFRNLLRTNHGDRLMLYDYGANLEELAFEIGTENADALAIQRIKTATDKYMPFISLNTFEPIKEASETSAGLANIAIRITFSVPSIDTTQQAVEVIIHAAG